MELSLQTVFDLGFSYGLGDDVFQESRLSVPPSPSETSMNNPLGRGVLCRLDVANDNLIAHWRDIATLMADDSEMELGYDIHSGISESEFRGRLKHIIKEHGIKLCDMTIYALGIGFLRLDLKSGICLQYLLGVARCFEFAAYQEIISAAFLKIARKAAEDALQTPRRRLGRPRRTTHIQEISRRPDPLISDRESSLLTKQGITHVVTCVDEKDDIEGIKSRMLPAGKYKKLEFEYHGTIWYNWSVCVLSPRTHTAGQSMEDTLIATKCTPDTGLFRILYCIQIAHSFLGSCQAVENLSSAVIAGQASLHLQARPGREAYLAHVYTRTFVADPMDLTRLRTLALTVVNKTKYTALTSAEEDKAYFALFEENANILNRHVEIERQCGEFLASVLQAEQLRLDGRFNMVVLCLTALTFVSAFVDAYSFVQGGGDEVIYGQPYRSLVIMFIVLLIALFIRFAAKASLASWRQ